MGCLDAREARIALGLKNSGPTSLPTNHEGVVIFEVEPARWPRAQNPHGAFILPGCDLEIFSLLRPVLERRARKMGLQILLATAMGTAYPVTVQKGQLAVVIFASPKQVELDPKPIYHAYSYRLNALHQGLVLRWPGGPGQMLFDPDGDPLAYYEGDSGGGVLWVLFNLAGGQKEARTDPALLLNRLLEHLQRMFRENGSPIELRGLEHILSMPVDLVGRLFQHLRDRRNPKWPAIRNALGAIAAYRAALKLLPGDSPERPTTQDSLHRAMAVLVELRTAGGQGASLPGNSEKSRITEALNRANALLETAEREVDQRLPPDHPAIRAAWQEIQAATENLGEQADGQGSPPALPPDSGSD